MKDKVIQISNGFEVISCGVCHRDTIEKLWCDHCIDVPGWRYTANPIQTMTYELLQADPHASLVVASKTGTGKTQCAYAALEAFFKHSSLKVCWLNPLKQIVKEKVDELRDVFPSKSVLELTGDTSDDVGFGLKRNISMQRADIIVTSYEMFDSLTRKPDIYTAISDVGLLIIDEIHSLGDSQRGAKLDGAITRFLLRMQRFGKTPQVVSLSATFQNVGDLQRFFEQFIKPYHVITNDFSPIKANVDQEVRWYYRDNIDIFANLVADYKDK
jgi:replicative superfamily II helicase